MELFLVLHQLPSKTSVLSLLLLKTGPSLLETGSIPRPLLHTLCICWSLFQCSQTLAELSSAGSLPVSVLDAPESSGQEGVSAGYLIKVILTTLSLGDWNLEKTSWGGRIVHYPL